MMEDAHIAEQEKLDSLMQKVFATPKPSEEPPPSTRADYKHKFRIRFKDKNPVFEEVEE